MNRDEDDVHYLAIQPEEEEFARWGSLEPDDFLHAIDGTVNLYDASGKLTDNIGKFSLYQVDVDGAIAERIASYDVFDTTAHTFAFWEALYTQSYAFHSRVLKVINPNDEWLPLNALLITRLEIFEPYRGHDYGLQAMRAMIQRFRIGIGLVAIKPYPLQFENSMNQAAREAKGLRFAGDYNTCVAKLRRHYARLGFQRIPRTPFMALTAALPLPRFDAS
jgi:GNAT superfamily N-acetyltransferase